MHIFVLIVCWTSCSGLINDALSKAVIGSDFLWIMESSFSSSSSSSISNWETLNLLVIRPILAITFVFVFLSIGWFLAWKLVLVHVPLVQEIFGLRKKPAKPKPPTRRFSRYYKYSSINSRSSDSG